MGDWQNFDNRAVIGRALRLRREIDDFEARWPTRRRGRRSFRASHGRSWSDSSSIWRRPRAGFDGPPPGVRDPEAGAFQASEMVLREILCMTWVLLDENFKPEVEEDRRT
jgi:hypothetical protein